MQIRDRVSVILTFEIVFEDKKLADEAVKATEKALALTDEDGEKVKVTQTEIKL